MTTVAVVSASKQDGVRLRRLLGRQIRFIDVEEESAAAADSPAARVDVVLVDLGTPAKHETFARRLRLARLLARRGVRVVATLGTRSDRAVAAVLDAGVAEYIILPFVKRDVLHHLQRAGLPAAVRQPAGTAVVRRSADQPAGRGPLALTLPELHDRKTGRIDAALVATYLGVPLKELAGALGMNYTTVHKTPASESAQVALRRLKRTLELLTDTLKDEARIRAWLHTPRPELENASPLETILAGDGGAVLSMLEGSLLGVPA
jgi:DNA-binding NarL/FixJ family response regulator